MKKKGNFQLPGLFLVICNVDDEGKMTTLAVPKLFKKWADVKMEYMTNASIHNNTKPFPVSSEIGGDMIKRYNDAKC